MDFKDLLNAVIKINNGKMQVKYGERPGQKVIMLVSKNNETMIVIDFRNDMVIAKTIDSVRIRAKLNTEEDVKVLFRALAEEQLNDACTYLNHVLKKEVVDVWRKGNFYENPILKAQIEDLAEQIIILNEDIDINNYLL